jgi:hypothetical protein
MKTRTSISLNIGVSLFILSGALTLLSQSAPARRAHVSEPYQQRVFDTPNESRRRWSNNRLISFRQYGKAQSETLVLYDQEGAISREATVSLAEAEVISLSDTTLNSSGSLFASGGTRDTKGRVAHFIAQLNEAGQVSRIVRTTPFMARQICVAKDDGTVWAYGGDQGTVKSSPVLEQYSLDKGLLKALFPRTELGPEWSLLDGRVPEQIHLSCSDEKVVLFNAESDVLLEYDLRSDQAIRQQISRLPAYKDLVVTGFCMTKDGLILASLYDKSRRPPMTGVFQLSFDNSRAVWVPLEETVHPAQPGSEFRILGTNGTDVIYSRSFGDRSLSWAKLTD